MIGRWVEQRSAALDAHVWDPADASRLNASQRESRKTTEITSDTEINSKVVSFPENVT